MNHPRRRRTLYAALACCAVLAAACGGNDSRKQAEKKTAIPAGDFFIGTRPVYARLVNEKGGSWIFTEITDSDAPLETGYLVRLNDLTPAFDTRAAECMPQVYPEGHRCNPAHPFRDKHAGVLDKIISGSIAVGTAGKVSDISQSYETRFEAPDFNRAVDEALVNTGLENDRRRLINLVEQYDATRREAQSRLDESLRRLAASQGDGDDLVVQLRPSVDGLTQYYEGDIDFDSLLEIEKIDGEEMPSVELETASILPCQARRCVAAAETALADLERQVAEREARLAELAQPGGAVYRLRCEQTTVDGYLLLAECPSEISVSGTSPVIVPLRVTILSRDFENLYPAFDLRDDNLRVTIENGAVVFANTTDEYLTLTAQTLYYNSQVHTTSMQIDIPPGISVSRDVDEFVSQPIGIESTYRQMTPDKAMGAEFQFGFAARYRMASHQQEQTLHDMRAFNVGCVISNRIEPGSCRSEAFADRNPAPSNPVDREDFGPL